MNKTDYLAEANRQLNIREHYEPIPSLNTKEITKKIDNLLSQAVRDKIIDKDTKDKLIVKHPSISKFYLRPKIHREGNPGRPIVSSIKCPTENISAYVDTKSRSAVMKADSHIKDTTHFLLETKDLEISPSDILVVIDAKSLYTSIPHDEGIQAMKEALLNEGLEETQVWLITELAEIILKNNEFEFNGKYYLQCQGTAMGTRMAPQYANLFMTWLETKMLNDWENPEDVKFWKRFIDDIFMIAFIKGSP